MTTKPLYEYLQSTLRIINKSFLPGPDLEGFSSGFTKLDYALGGINREYIVIASLCWDGLADFGLQLGLNLSKGGHTGAVFDLSNTPEFNALRILSMESGIPFDMIRCGVIATEELGKLMVTAGKLEDIPLVLQERKLYTMEELAKRIRSLVLEGGCQWILINNLNEVDADSFDIPLSQQLIEKSQKIRDLQAELKIPIITMLQLQEDNKVDLPSMIFRREAECCLYDADTILLLRKGEENSEKKPKTFEMELAIVQQPNGSLGSLYFESLSRKGMFQEI